MKTTIFSLFIASSIFLSCAKEPSTANENLVWQVGGDLQEVTKTFNSESSELLNIEVFRNSLCENTGVKITIEQNNITIYDQEIDSMDFAESIDIEPNSEIMIIRKPFNIEENDVLCVWLGLAECKVTY